MGPPEETAKALCQEIKRHGKQSVKIQKGTKFFEESPLEIAMDLTPGSNNMANNPKCPSTVSSYVGGFL